MPRAADASPSWAQLPHVQLTCARADVASASEAAWALQQARSEQPGLALLHAGGSLADATIATQTAAGLRAGLAPKLGGLLALQQGAGALRLAPSMLFSSTAALLGPAGQAGYAAANAAVNAWAQQQATAGLATLMQAACLSCSGNCCLWT